MVIPKSVFSRALSAMVVTVTAVAWAEVQIPPGYEVVNITDDAENDRFPRMNNCGEVVFRKELPGGRLAVFLYDNGKTTQVSTDGQYNTYPDVNDDGVIVWTRWDAGTPGQILIFEDGLITQLTDDPAHDKGARINNLGHVLWARWYFDGCGLARTDIMFYDGATIEQLTQDVYTKQQASSNEHGEIVWAWADFCFSPPVSEIMLWIDGVTTQLTIGQPQPSSPSINDGGEVVWGAGDGLYLWKDGVTTHLTDWGKGPSMNNRGDILFHRWHKDEELTLLWLYRDGAFRQITDGPFSDTGSDINVDGEVVWRSHPVANQRDIGMMRRVRDGDVDIDFDVDRGDFASFPVCMTGPVDTDHLCGCRFLDTDHDRDVDLGDFARLQNLFTGEN